MNLQTITNSEFGDIRVQTANKQTQNKEPWFVAKDLTDILGYGQTIRALQLLDDDEKLRCQISTSGQNRNMWMVNESGLYNLIFRSTKPIAKKFRKWVTSEVLPSIRKKGMYVRPYPQSIPSISASDRDMLATLRNYLLPGDYTEIASKTGKSKHTIHKVLYGGRRNEAVIKASLSCARHNKEEVLFSGWYSKSLKKQVKTLTINPLKPIK